jgi:NAD(P)-dependent dehydrogenase (short-subunit alcohol dehydrogenase family)
MAGLLAGKSALITGAASGIGRATALAFAREGAWVAAADLALEGAKETLGLIEAAGGQGVALQVEVTDEASVQAMVQGAVAAFGGLDCAFNNAGIATAKVGASGQKIADVSLESWNRLLAVNLTGVFLCLKHEVLQMRQQKGGAIVNTASVAGLLGLPGASSYPASKHGVVGLTRTAAADHAEDHIRVNAICPGYVETPMTVDARQRHGNRLFARVPQGRFGQPEEIAEAVVFLCSDRASFVTGSCWTADGGYSAI